MNRKKKEKKKKDNEKKDKKNKKKRRKLFIHFPLSLHLFPNLLFTHTKRKRKKFRKREKKKKEEKCRKEWQSTKSGNTACVLSLHCCTTAHCTFRFQFCTARKEFFFLCRICDSHYSLPRYICVLFSSLFGAFVFQVFFLSLHS